MRAAATDESTPPLIAARTFIGMAPAAARAARRARATAPGSTSNAASTSASTLVCPSERRNDPRALAASTPIAINTCEGCATPAVQADPVEHSIPLASNNINSASPSQPRKVKCALPASRIGSSAPLRQTSSISASTPSTRRSRSSRNRALFSSSPSTAICAAVAIPTALATSGVPERISRSCPPPCIRGTQVTSRRSSNAPTPGGPPNLCPATLIADSPLAPKSSGSCPTA